MAKTGQFFHSSTITTDVTGVGQSYDATKFHEHSMYDANEQLSTQGRFKGRIETIIVRVKGLNAATTKISVSGACDENGDYIWFPDTEATIATGITTSTTGSAVYEYKLPVRQFFDSDKMYLFFKCDGGAGITCTVDASCIVWSE